MKPFRSPRLRAVLAVASVVVATVFAIPLRALAQTSPTEESCGSPESPPAARLDWVELPAPDSETVASTVTLRVTSLVDTPADVRVAIIGDAAGPNKHKLKRFRIRSLPARGTADIDVDPAFLKRSTESMARSGQLVPAARFVPEGACEGGVCGKPTRPGATPPPPGAIGEGPTILTAPAIYFHRDSVGDAFTFYGEAILHSRYAGGDLAGAFEIDPDSTTERATDDGPGLPDTLALETEAALAPADDDPLPFDAGDIPQASYRLCFKFEIGLTDAGKMIANKTGALETEDYWNGYSKGDGKKLAIGWGTTMNTIVTARGVAVKLQTAGGSTPLTYTDPASGCITYTPGLPPPLQVLVYAQFKDQFDNIVRVHDTNDKTFSWVTTVDAKPGKTTVVAVGDYSARATLAAVAGFSMYRTAFGVSGKQIDVAESNFCVDAPDPSGNESSAHFNFDDLDVGLAHVRIHDGTNPDCSPSDHRRMKFIVSHELGHAWLLLRTQISEPSADASLVDATETECIINEEGYSLGSVEYSSIGFREGAAHLYATRVWNDRDAEAVFSFFATPQDVETNKPDMEGGRLMNVCTIETTYGRSTNLDWLRFWWDWYAPSGADTLPSINAIAQIYVDTVLGGGLARETYWQQLQTATNAAIADPAVIDRFNCASSWNGIRTSGVAVNCNSFPTPP